MGGNDDSSKEDFVVFSTKDIVLALHSAEVAAVSTPLDRARLFEECRILSVDYGGTFARTFDLTGPRGDQLTPPVLAIPPQPRPRKRPREVPPPPPKKKMLKYEGTLQQGGAG